MSNRPTRLERYKRWAQNHRVLAPILIVVAVILGAGAVAGSIENLSSFWSRIRSPEDPRVFRYGGNTVTLADGNGMTFEQAIKVKGAFNTDVGVKAEYNWLERFYIGYNFICQVSVARDGKRYDVFVVRSPTDGERQVHFDVTEFFATPLAKADTIRAEVRYNQLYKPNPSTPAEVNGNRCASIEGAVALIGSPYPGGGRITQTPR